MLILVTGGAGYIGSHTCVELLNNNHDVIIVDNLVNSKAETIDRIWAITKKRPLFYHADATDDQAMDLIFGTHKPDGVIHFAGLKAVGESVQVPLAYYRNNLLSTTIVSNMECIVSSLVLPPPSMVTIKCHFWKRWNCCPERTLMVKRRPCVRGFYRMWPR